MSNWDGADVSDALSSTSLCKSASRESEDRNGDDDLVLFDRRQEQEDSAESVSNISCNKMFGS